MVEDSQVIIFVLNLALFHQCHLPQGNKCLGCCSVPTEQNAPATENKTHKQKSQKKVINIYTYP